MNPSGFVPLQARHLLQCHQEQGWTGARQGRSLTYHTQPRWGADPSESIRTPLPQHQFTPHLHCTLSSRPPPPRSKHLVCERHLSNSFPLNTSLLHRSHSSFAPGSRLLRYNKRTTPSSSQLPSSPLHSLITSPSPRPLVALQHQLSALQVPATPIPFIPLITTNSFLLRPSS